MTVYIGGAEFVARLQRENNELLAENIELRKEIKQLLEHARTDREREMEFSASIVPLVTDAQSKPTIEKCVICGNYSNGGTYGDQFPLCFECYNGRAEDIHKYIEMLETKGQEQQ